jgi:predicted ester cyclase
MNPEKAVTPEDIVLRYLRVFVTRDLAELARLVDEEVEIHGAGSRVRGRHFVEGAVQQAGLTCTRVEVIELFASGERVTVYFRQHLVHDRSGREVTLTGIKMYQVVDQRIVRFWGETDLNGLLRQLGMADGEISF